MIRVLFVDDETRILEGMRRSMYCMRSEWEMRFADSGIHALESLEVEPADVVVSDMRMPDMDGVQLLAEVKRLYPQSTRLILSGEADQERIIRATGPAQQYLSKPCDASTLKSAIARTKKLKGMLTNERLAEIVGSVDTLPSPPKAYQELLANLRSDDASIDEIARIIRRDLAMTAKIVNIANSGFFGLRTQVQTVERALAFIGVDTITALVLGQELFATESPITFPGFDLERLAHHSFDTAACARAIARHERLPGKLAEAAFLAGVLHDLGKLVLVTRRPPASPSLREQWLADTRILIDTQHAEVGAYLLGLWSFPDAIVEAIAWHHDPAQCGEDSFGLCGVLHVADIMAHERYPNSSDAASGSLRTAYLEHLGLAGRWPEWQAAVPDMELTNTVRTL
jgi:HD-like signal output (HDOD) protein